MTSLFIADLHLERDRPDITGRFLSLLEQLPEKADRLFILGDLFEVWLGDDCIPPEYHDTLQAIRRATERGTRIYLQAGNRDFLIGDAFARQTGITLIPELLRIDLNGTPTLITHGDLFCTNDQPYQAMRAKLRNPVFIDEFLGKSPPERIEFARQLRNQSQEETRQKSLYEMDVANETLSQYANQFQIDRVIHGHTHRIGVHRDVIEGRTIERFVVGDWTVEESLLLCDESGCRLRRLADLVN